MEDFSIPNWLIDDFFSSFDDNILVEELDKIIDEEGNLNSESRGEVDQFINENKNKNTAKKTKTDLNVWQRWCSTINESRALEDIPPNELDGLLSLFFIKARKLDGSEYEPSTLTSFQRSFDRYLRENGKLYSILTDREFSKSREVLECKRRKLREKGKGRRPNKALGLNSTQMEKLWQTKQLGDHSPDALIRTVWLNNTMHFGWRAQDEHRKVLFGDLEIQKDENEDKREYVIWHTERGSKTRTGGKEFGPERYFNPRMYATADERCPVKMFKSYLEHRPAETMGPDCPFYLAVVKNPSSNTWYKRQPLGAHSLASFMKQMTANADTSGKHTNHSARRTMMTTLRHGGFNPLDIGQLSGHKNLKSIDSYSSVSEEQQMSMSLAISKLSNPQKRVPLSDINPNEASTSTASSQQSLESAISGGIFNNCTFNMLGTTSNPSVEAPVKRRRCVIESDDEDE